MATKKPYKKSNYVLFNHQKEEVYIRDVDSDLQSIFTYLSTFPPVYKQSTQPTLQSDSLGFWKDTSNSKFYLMLNISGNTKKVELI